ncbi:uncharacterized protein BDCG_05785 [Blastomyces dermatitidis ER-3]|nr:uncharacterized protein BDCG_05785 [Blastomyces dermatitidis ER-3]EEQ90665.2 hypothetical protein BDCG_05785 [Blastomyces dermatitidis ER-3]EQL29169.1 hypothetical protein BDFG_08162 [Blastomyces dermatitidis ATCC 26199]
MQDRENKVTPNEHVGVKGPQGILPSSYHESPNIFRFCRITSLLQARFMLELRGEYIVCIITRNGHAQIQDINLGWKLKSKLEKALLATSAMKLYNIRPRVGREVVLWMWIERDNPPNETQSTLHGLLAVLDEDMQLLLYYCYVMHGNNEEPMQVPGREVERWRKGPKSTGCDMFLLNAGAMCNAIVSLRGFVQSITTRQRRDNLTNEALTVQT